MSHDTTATTEPARVSGVAAAGVPAQRDVYYFGCVNGIGHGLYNSRGHHIHYADGMPWTVKQLDCGLLSASYGQRQGDAALVQTHGWTALSFWDRTVDGRGNSNSAFVARGLFTLEEMKALARAAFPDIFSRLNFELRID